MIRSHRHFPADSAGFTLVELMISIALVLLLVIGVNQVFHLTSQTVGTGQASSTAQRNMRAAQKVMQDDFAGALTTNGPFFIINSQRAYAFRNKPDELTDTDHAPGTQDVQRLGGIEPTLSTALYGDRNRRLDLIKFFSRGQFHRQTGNPIVPASFISSTTANEALISYGHGQLPDNALAFSTSTMPGAGTAASNPNNYYSSQWMLVRQAMLLKSSLAPTEVQYTKNTLAVGTPPDLSPLTATSVSAPGAAIAPVVSPPSSVYDLANMSIDSFSADLAARIRAGSGNTPNIWYRLLASPGIVPFTGTSNTTDLLYRLQCNPFIQKPLTIAGAAKSSPQFVTGCSQFIVEFAGDFVGQNAAGDVIDDQPDGQIDFFIPSTGVNQGARQIRWYGLPRDLDGDGVIRGIGGPGNAYSNNDLTDVVPVRDVIQSGAHTGVVHAAIPGLATHTAPFEREVDFASPGVTPPAIYGVPAVADYAALGGAGMDPKSNYLCIWTFGGPSMVRIIMTLDDPNGRLPDGATFEYVFNLKK